MHSFDLGHTDAEVVIVEWHVSWPGYDPWYYANTVDNDGRKDFYNITGVPAFKTDGWLPSNSSTLQPHWEYEYYDNGDVPVMLTLTGDYDPGTKTGNFQVTATLTGELPEGSYKIFAVVTEEQTYYQGNYYDTMHKAYPNFNGWAVSDFPATVSSSFDLNDDATGEWDDTECRIVVWLQDTLVQKKVQQAASSFVFDLGDATDVAEAPMLYELGRNFPNPFNPKTSIPVKMKAAGEVLVEVLSADGRRVAVLHDGPLDSGSHDFTWNGTDLSGRKMASGVYMAQVTGKLGSQSQRMVLMK